MLILVVDTQVYIFFKTAILVINDLIVYETNTYLHLNIYIWITFEPVSASVSSKSIHDVVLRLEQFV